jgi:hypothetical protein
VLGTLYCDIKEERNHVPDEERVLLLVLHKQVCSVQPNPLCLYLKKDEGSVCYEREGNGLEGQNLDMDDDDDDEGSNNQRILFWVNFRV